jgi:hypothetical protein
MMVPFSICTKHLQISIRRQEDHCLGRWVDLHPNLRILTVQFACYFQCVCTSFLAQNLVGEKCAVSQENWLHPVIFTMQHDLQRRNQACLTVVLG